MSARSVVGGIALAMVACDAVPTSGSRAATRTAIDPPRPLGPSLIATGVAPALFTWTPPAAAVGRYDLELDDRCGAGDLAGCAFTSAHRVTVTEPRWRDDRDRRGRHAWRVRACSSLRAGD